VHARLQSNSLKRPHYNQSLHTHSTPDGVIVPKFAVDFDDVYALINEKILNLDRALPHTILPAEQHHATFEMTESNGPQTTSIGTDEDPTRGMPYHDKVTQDLKAMLTKRRILERNTVRHRVLVDSNL
jgi:hypothetical protein